MAQLEKRPALRALEKVVSEEGFKTVVTLRLAPVLPIPLGAYNYGSFLSHTHGRIDLSGHIHPWYALLEMPVCGSRGFLSHPYRRKYEPSSLCDLFFWWARSYLIVRLATSIVPARARGDHHAREGYQEQ